MAAEVRRVRKQLCIGQPSSSGASKQRSKRVLRSTSPQDVIAAGLFQPRALAAQELRPDAVVSESGFAMCRALRTHDETPTIARSSALSPAAWLQ
jgi:hypothetical protein